MNSSSSVLLVSELQKYIVDIKNSNFASKSETISVNRSIPSNKVTVQRNTMSCYEAPANHGYHINQLNTNSGYYNLWTSNYGLDQSITFCDQLSVGGSYHSTNDSSSISPASSIDSNSSSNNDFYNQRSSHNYKKNLPLPSSKASIDLSKFKTNKNMICTFCVNNKEPANVYTSHLLKDSRGRITCPFLKIYKCPICGESGQNAHTITYCKKFKNQKRNEMLKNL